MQRESIRRYATFRNVEIGEWIEDLDQSGGTIDRPGFQRALTRVERQQSDGLVVAKLDRFARSLPTAYEAIERIAAAGGTFVSVQDDFDLSTSQGKLVFNIMSSFAQFERDRLTESWATAQARAIERGMHFSVPVGYDRGPDGRLEPNSDAQTIRELFHRRAAGESWTALARFLTGRVKPPKAEQWTQRTVAHIVANRAYLGEAFHGQHRNPTAHDPIVSAAEFEAAQSARAVTATARHEGLLTGIIRCAGCRHRMKTDRYGPANGRTRIYRCRRRHGSGDCPAPATVTATLVESWVERQFVRHVQALEVEAARDSPDLTQAQLAASKAQHRLEAFRDDLEIQETLGRDDYLAGLRVRAEAHRTALDALGRLQAQSAHPIELTEWSAYTVEEKRLVLSAAIDAVFLSRTGAAPIADRARIFWRGELVDDLPGRGRPLEWAGGDPPSGVARLEDFRDSARGG